MSEQVLNRSSLSLLAEKGRARPSLFDVQEVNQSLSPYEPATPSSNDDGLDGLIRRKVAPKKVILPRVPDGEILALVKKSRLKLDICDNDRERHGKESKETTATSPTFSKLPPRKQLTVRIPLADYKRLQALVKLSDQTYQDVLAKGIKTMLEHG